MKKEMIQQLDREHVIYSWKVQGQHKPLLIDRADGIYLYDYEGKPYVDFCAGLINVNIGHNNQYVLDAMRAQMEKFTFISPAFCTEAKAKLASMIADVTPGDLNHTFFVNGGAEAIENAIKTVRWYTGRHKIYSAWRGYHGASAGAISITGDPRRWAAEPGIPGAVKFFGPYGYHCPFGGVDTEDSGRRALEVLKTQIMLDGPHTIAAIFMEPIVGTNGIIPPSKYFMKGVRELCDQHGILLVIDEVMAGWGRSGKWFGIQHYDIIPDIIVTAKGITSGYIQLGAVIWSSKIWKHFQKQPFVGGLTYTGHALACATGAANIDVYRNENLIEKSAINGAYMLTKMEELKVKHPCIGDVRGKGLWGCIELTSNRETRAPLAGFLDSRQSIMPDFTKKLLKNGLSLFAKWDFIFLAPPLIITQDQIDDVIERLDDALYDLDKLL